MKHSSIAVLLSIILTNINYLSASSKLSEYEVTKIRKLLHLVKPLAKLNVNATNLSMENDIRKFKSGYKNEDIKLSYIELIEKYGYITEEHEVTTKDGYILTVQRIPNEGPVVFLMHGILGSADDWILAGPDISLAYYLASEGYDVWMGNARGNKYSRKHKNFEVDCGKFWNFSWDEIGRYDLQAMIDFVLELTCKDKLTYIGYSQGTTVSFVLLSELPEYNDKISLVIALSPIAWMTHTKSSVLKILSLSNPIDITLLKAIGRYKVKPHDKAVKVIAEELCGDNEFSKIICSHYALLITGFNREYMNFTNLPFILSHFPAGGGSKVFQHYTQVIDSSQFRRYDYDGHYNVDLYDSLLPPDYAVENIKAPVALFYSDSDWLSDIKDVEILKEKLTNVVASCIVENYSNIDFIWAPSAKKLVNERVLELIKEYNHD